MPHLEATQHAVAGAEPWRCPGAWEPGHRQGSASATGEPIAIFARATSAVRRRCRAAWQWMSSTDAPSRLIAAFHRLQAYGGAAGLAPTPGAPICPTLTATAMPTLLDFGEVRLARRFAERLVANQCAEGGFPSNSSRFGSPFCTAQAIGGLLAVEDAGVLDSAAPIERAAAWLAARIGPMGHFDLSELPPTSIDVWAAPTVQVACLPALHRASERFGVPAWRQAAQRAAQRLRQCGSGMSCGQGNHFASMAVEAWLALGEVELARDAVRLPAAAQHRDGAVPAEPGGRWICSATLAHLAFIAYKLGQRAFADRALACLRSRQLPTGGFPDGWWHGRRPRASRESAWTWLHFLQASLAQVRTSFECSVADLPDRIDPADGRFQAVRSWCGSLGRSPKIADIGCGSGRFVRELARQVPTVRLVAIDPSRSALDRCPQSADRRLGSLLRIPAPDGEFDGALAVESLEHSLLPERAIAELCRVVRPGGRILVIDKHRSKQRLSEHEPWEQWFLPETVSSWLARHCHGVAARPIAHGRSHEPDGLFWCWEATR